MDSIRTLEIEIFLDIDWKIEDKRLAKAGPRDRVPYFEGEIAAGKIAYLFGIGFEDLPKAFADDKFKEICRFIHVSENGEKIREFEADFLGAIEYVQSEFKKSRETLSYKERKKILYNGIAKERK